MTTESENLAATLHATEHRVTGQRRLLLEIIRAEGEHLDAEELYRLARRQYPRLSRSTVYRTMRLLRDLGLIDEVHLGEDHHHYEIKAPVHHHHLICLRCGQVLEFSSPRTEALASAVARQHGFEIRETRIDLTGYCADCRRAMQSSSVHGS
jgi:Fur family transcriptional regulator, ferric uptake regulator